jgi:hypothetical protein
MLEVSGKIAESMLILHAKSSIHFHKFLIGLQSGSAVIDRIKFSTEKISIPSIE